MSKDKRTAPAPNPAGDQTAPAPRSAVEVVDIQFRTGAKIYFFNPNGLHLKSGDHVIIETTRGPEFGTCTGGNHTVPFKDIIPPLRKVLRVATENDEKTLAANRAKEKKAYEICLQKIQESRLDMQLVSAECAFDGSKILFFFTSDDRVDFRELVKHLAGIFRTRIELRQIGVRDKAKMMGGLGICGRPFCCTEFLDDFQPVSIKMAKTQNLSLNPTKISGTCGRLMCCLKYEQDAYEDLLRTSPKMDSFVDTPDGRGTIIEVNLLRSRVRVRMEEQPETVNTYLNSEICVLRSGKAKKNDPPIPADLAPISGNGKRPRFVATPEPETPIQLDPIRFRYRPEDIVEEPEVPSGTETPKPEERRKKKRPATHTEDSPRERTPREKPQKAHGEGKESGAKAEVPGKSGGEGHKAARRKPAGDAKAKKSGGEGTTAPKAHKETPKPKAEKPRQKPVKQEGHPTGKQETKHEGKPEGAPKKPGGFHHRRRPGGHPRRPHEGGKQGS